MPKGITPVIAIVLLLMVTVAIAGGAFVFLSSTFRGASQTTGEQMESQLKKMSGRFAIDNIDKNRAYLRNTGTTEINDIQFYVDSVKVSATGPASLQPGATEAFTLSYAEMPVADELGLKVSSGIFQIERKIKLQNILLNGNFEAGASYPDDWSQPPYAERIADAYEGSYAVKITCEETTCSCGEGCWWAGINQRKTYGTYALGRAYVATMKYKCPAGRYGYVFLGDDNNYGKWAGGASQLADGTWKTLQAMLYMDTDQPDTGTLSVYIYGHVPDGPGYCQYDALALYELYG